MSIKLSPQSSVNYPLRLMDCYCNVAGRRSGDTRSIMDNVVRRWWYCVPWVLVYGLNTVGLFASGIIAFYQLEDQLKLIGLLPIGYGQEHYIYIISTAHCNVRPQEASSWCSTSWWSSSCWSRDTSCRVWRCGPYPPYPASCPGGTR